jgi:ATP-binding cassette subfamily B protein
VTGVRVIKAFGQMAQLSSRYRGEAERLVTTNLRAVRARSKFWSLDAMLLNLTLAVILLGGGLRVAAGRMTIGGLVAFVSYQLMLVWPMRAFGWIIATSQEAMTATERVFEVFDLVPTIADHPGAQPLDTTRGHIRFEDVEFVYPGTSLRILAGLDLEVLPGETLALVGMTGSGKTTVAALVSRFYDPTSGRITLDGRDISELTLRSLRSHIGVAFEDPILFSASIRENLLMGAGVRGAERLGISVDEVPDDELWDALAAAQADGFVRELPWQLDTRVGEQGYSLSGGQRQRLALARAILGRPSILVLDDPLSAVDVHTEAAIETALRAVLRGRTGILIAHRPSTVLLADRVALLHAGRVVATGTHSELLATVPLYREVLAKESELAEEHA